MRFFRNLLSAMALFLCAAAWAQKAPAPDPRGLYVYSWDFAISESPFAPEAAGLSQAIGVPGLTPPASGVQGLDGITLVENWSSIEPEMGVFQWDLANSAKWNWSSTNFYVTGDEVLFNSQVYVSQIDNNVGQQPKPLCTGPNCAWHLAGTSTPDLLDQWIRAAIAAGNKKIILAIRAGQDTPCWLFDSSTGQCSGGLPNDAIATANATRLQFLASAHQGLGKCLGVSMAAPWDPVFESEWDKMLGALAAHLKATPGPDKHSSLYDFITMVRITGINRTTDEFRVPEEVLADVTGCPNAPPYPDPTTIVNSIQTWLDAGYTPSRLLQGWDFITQSFERHFGDKSLNVPIIPTGIGADGNQGAANAQYPFPPIDDNGCVYQAGVPNNTTVVWTTQPCFNNAASVPDQDLAPITLAAQKFPGTLTVEFENIHFNPNAGSADPPSPAVVGYAETLGVIPAFQTNNYFGAAGGGTSCWPLTNPARCFPEWYGFMLGAGISPASISTPIDPLLHSQFVEVFFPDINGNECTPVAPPAGLTRQQLQDAAPGDGCGYPAEVAQAHSDITSPPMVAISFPKATRTHWFTRLPVVGEVSANSTGGAITQLSCTGAASGSDPAGFRLHVKEQGNPITVTCTAQDAAGNENESIRALWIDTDPPVTSSSVNFLPSGIAIVGLTSTDAISGVAETRYRINGGSWTSGTSIILAQSGVYTIDFRSTDVAGNVESTQSITVTVSVNPPPGCKGTQCL